MPLFAHIETGYAVDVLEADDTDAYKKRFGDLADKWTIMEVPDGTQPGAKYNGDGTFTNPKPAEPPAPPPPAADPLIKMAADIAAIKLKVGA